MDIKKIKKAVLYGRSIGMNSREVAEAVDTPLEIVNKYWSEALSKQQIDEIVDAGIQSRLIA